jgi:hypothetical protein
MRTSKDFRFRIYSGVVIKCEDFQNIEVRLERGQIVRVWPSNTDYERDGARVNCFDLKPGMAVEVVVPRIGACPDNIVLTEPGGHS